MSDEIDYREDDVLNEELVRVVSSGRSSRSSRCSSGVDLIDRCVIDVCVLL